MNQADTLLYAAPIREIITDMIDPCYVETVRRYLEHDLGCEFTSMGNGCYLIRFPEGTMEEVHRGRSTQWTRETTLCFHNGTTLTKYVFSPLNESQRERIGLAFPSAILDRPATERKRQNAAESTPEDGRPTEQETFS